MIPQVGKHLKNGEPSAQGKVELVENGRGDVWLWLGDNVWLPAAVGELLQSLALLIVFAF